MCLSKMSDQTYNELLIQSSEYLSETTQADASVLEGGMRDRVILAPQLYELKVRYTILVKKLDEVYDQMVQPQKRIIVKKMLDGCLGRLLEIKHELVEVEMSDFTFDNDEVLSHLQVTPYEAEPSVPQYFVQDREDEVNYRRQFIEDILRKFGHEPVVPKAIVLTEKQAVLIIQSHERARQGRLRGQFMKEIRLLKEKGRDQKGEMSAAAATAIQRVWRGFLARRETKKRRNKEMLLIGMEMPPYKESTARKKVEEVKDYRRKLQKEREKEYQEALESMEEILKAKFGDKMHEQISEELKRWVKEFFDRTGKLPEMPSEESGGSRTMFSRQGTGSVSELSKSPVSSKESKKSKESKDKKPTKAEDNKGKDELEDLQMYTCAPSMFLDDIVSANEEFEDVWKYRDDANEPYHKDMIERDKLTKIEQEERKAVDGMIRGELETLQAAYDRDRASKGKRPKKPQKKVRRSGKKSKKKKEKDLTPDRTTESLFEELICNGIIKPYSKVRIDNFIGEKCYLGTELRNQGEEPLPLLGNVRELVKEYCILPLGSEHVRSNTPLVRSVLLSGPSGSGKKMLIHAICTELGGVLFDLTPANIVGKYPGKTGLIMLLHLITKVSRLLQPAVIWMDDAEKPFVKKIPKTDKTDPKRLKKDLIKIIKAIYPEDRVIFIGTSKSPWDAEQKLLYQCYNKVIQIPRADFGSISMFWTKRLHKTGALSPKLNISCLCRISDSFTIGTLLAALSDVLTTKRTLQLKVRALTAQEIAVQLSSRDPVYAEQDLAAENWWIKTPTERRRQKSMQRLEELKQEVEEKAASAANVLERKQPS